MSDNHSTAQHDKLHNPAKPPQRGPNNQAKLYRKVCLQTRIRTGLQGTTLHNQATTLNSRLDGPPRHTAPLRVANSATKDHAAAADWQQPLHKTWLGSVALTDASQGRRCVHGGS